MVRVIDRVRACAGFFRWLLFASLVAVLLHSTRLVWMATGRGIDVTDEGIYLVSYRWYRHPELVFNGAPALLGPLFQLVHWNVAWLRRMKLLLSLSSGLGLGLAVLAWVRRARVGLRMDRATRGAVVTFFTLGSFTIYAWLPHSPGYNDVGVFATTTAGACAVGAVALDGATRALLFGGAGAALLLEGINKWPAGVCGALALGIGLGVCLGWRAWLRAVLAWSVGAALALTLLALWSANLLGRIRELRRASESLSSNIPIRDTYLVRYWDDLREVSSRVATHYWWFVLAVAFALSAERFVRGRSARALCAAGALGAPTALFVEASHDGLFLGGSDNISLGQSFLPLVLSAGVVLLIAQMARQRLSRTAHVTVGSTICGAPATTRPAAISPEREGLGVVLTLGGLAVAQAVGTLNPVLYIVGAAGALLFGAVVVIMVFAVDLRSPTSVAMGVMLLACSALVPDRQVITGLWQRPYRVNGDLGTQTVPLGDVPGYESLRTDPLTAELLRGLAALARRRGIDGRPGMSIFATPGLTLAMGLRHPPAALFVRSEERDPQSAKLYEERIADACRRGFIDPSDPPVILAPGTSAPAALSRVLSSCGVIFPGRYQVEFVSSPGIPGVPAGPIGVWVPTS